MNLTFFKNASIWVVTILTITLTACGGGSSGSGNSTAVSSTNPFFTELTGSNGLREFYAGSSYTQRAPEAWIESAIKNNDGTYTLSGNVQYLNSGTWGSQASITKGYYLSSAGSWVANTTSDTQRVSDNNNGTITVYDTSMGNITATPVAVDISGAGINTGKDFTVSVPSGSKVVKVGVVNAIDAAGYYTPGTSVISGSATYPAGSTVWVLTGIVSQQDNYSIYNAAVPQVKTPSGNLASLDFASATSFTLDNPLCFANVRMVYSSSTASNKATFDVYQASTCTAVTAGTTKLATVDLTFTTVRTQAVVETSNYSVSGTQYPFVYVYPTITETAFFAAVNGAVYWGMKLPAHSAVDEMATSKSGYMNKAAMDAVMNAALIPTF